MRTPPSLPPPPPRRRTTAGSLLPLLLLVLLVVVRPATGQKYANGNNEAAASASDSVGNGNKFVPPKLSFTSSDYYASLRDDNVVKSVHQMYEEEGAVGSAEHKEGGNGQREEGEKDYAPWTVFQASPDAASVVPIKRRSGPLLTVFPDGRRARHVVLSPEERRSHLVSNAEVCHPDDPPALLARYDLLASSAETSSLATELWKYCALYAEGGVYVDADSAPLAALGDVLGWRGGEDGDSGNVNCAATSASRDSGVSPSLLGERGGANASVISDPVDSSTARGTGRPVGISSFVAISSPRNAVPLGMILTVMTAQPGRLATDALLLPRALAAYMDEEGERGGWWARLRQRCSGVLVAEPPPRADDDGGGGRTLLRRCAESAGYCCEIQDPTSAYVFLLSRQPLVPNQVMPAAASLPVPYGAASDVPESGGGTAFLSTVREEPSSPLLSLIADGKPFSPGSSESTPNVYEILSSEGALPNQVPNRQACMDCLREKKASDCVICAEKCGKFCERVCDVEVREKPVRRVVSVEGPRYRKDPERLIPRIVHQVSDRRGRGDDASGREDVALLFHHRLFLILTIGTNNSSFILLSSFQQTWFEPVTPEKYPNMSRLIESWKRSGWEYHFWDDASAADFLSLHFPKEVREAYDSILPGAFKADLFRYCVLLIMGGIYSDMDVMLESNLDAAVPPDVGFMVPVDAPGTRPDKRMCLWNGFIASAPAHPFLVRVIEHVVNNIRNRFTVVDYDRMMCPMPETSVVHAFSTLFTAGPCILGLTVNEVMGRGLQQTFVEGDLVGPEEGGSGMVVPGRTIILKQNKWDMGGECVA